MTKVEIGPEPSRASFRSPPPGFPNSRAHGPWGSGHPRTGRIPARRFLRRRVRSGPASDRQGAQAKGPKAPSPGPDRRVDEGRESGSARFQAAAVKRDAKRAPGAAVPQARSVQRSAELFPWLFLRPASARLAGPARMRGKPRPKGGAEHRDARSRAGVSFRGRASKKGEGPALAAASADPVERKRHAVTCMTGMPACRALSTRLAVMPAPGNATMPFGRRLMMSSFLRNGAALP